MASGRLALSAMLILTGFVVGSLLIAFYDPLPLGFLYPETVFAEISGFAALFLVAATGTMMFFRKQILRSTKDPDALRDLHVVIAALGGLFLIIHVGFFLLMRLTLPVLFGYLGAYVAFVVWVTGAVYLEGYRSSLFYHGLLALIAVSLIVVHVVSAGRDIPVLASGIALVVIAAVVVIGALKPIAELPAEGTARRAGA